MKNPYFLRIAGAELAALTLTAGQILAADKPAASKPNIIFILSDDVGIGNISCCGGPFKTPNIDTLAKNGTRFEFCYSNPLCGPSRCEALTGRYPFRTGLNSNNSADAIAPTTEVMIQNVMKKAGYATFCGGKWGQMCFGPAEWGFDESIVFGTRGTSRYWAEQGSTYIINGKTSGLPEGTYFPDLVHHSIMDFIKRHKDQPFFVYYPMSHSHSPILRTPDSKPGTKDPDQLYADTIEYMDKLVGRLVGELTELGLRENTLIIFTGDNGTAAFAHELATVDGKIISGHKATMLEGGSRVPLVVNWPGHTPAGKVSRDLIDFSDFFPTFAELGGAALPAGVIIDGHSFAPQVRGEKGILRDWVYVELGGKSYARNTGFKLTNTGELFDMSNAPFEEIPVQGTTDARFALQKTLDQHPALTKEPKSGKKKNKQAKKKAVNQNSSL